MAKVTISIPDELLASLDEYADSNFTTRSGAITMMVNGYLSSRKITSSLAQVSSALDTLASGKQLSAEDQAQLDAFSALARILPKT